MKTIQVFVPVGAAPAAQTRASSAAAREDSALRVIGLLDNHKHNSDKVLEHLASRLEERYEAFRFVRVQKPEAGKGAPQAMIESLAAQCQVVVNGIGDWGSCTSWSLHDSAQLESRGVATVTIVTSGFVQATEAHRKLLKHPELPYCVVPHPIVSMDDNALHAAADAIIDSISVAIGRALPASVSSASPDT